MSLFAVEERVARRIGALSLLLVGGGITGVLLTSGRSLGPGVQFDVSFSQAGALRSGARVRVAGRDVGEVSALRNERMPDGGSRVIARCFVTRSWAYALHRHDAYFVATPSLLGEAYLEVAPPVPVPAPGGSGDVVPEEGPVVTDGERVVGVDPPAIDRLVPRIYGQSMAILALLREHKPEVDELVAATDGVLATLAGVTSDPGQLGRIRDGATHALEDAAAIGRALDEADAPARVRALARDLGETADRLAPEIASLGEKAARSIERIDGLRDVWTPERRARVERGLAAMQHALAVGGVILDELTLMSARFERGEGTLGALAADTELYDELHEVHRILKSQPWSLLVKPEKIPAHKPALGPRPR